MIGPSDTLRQLAARGREIRAKLIAISESKKNSNANVSVGVDILDAFFDLSGHKRTATGLGKRLMSNSIKARETEITQEYDGWKSSVDSLLANYVLTVSEIHSTKSKLTLKEQFDKTQTYTKLETNLRKGIVFLEEVADKGLIVKHIEHVSKEHKQELQVPDYFDNSLGVNARNILSRLNAYPVVQKAIEGAFSVVASHGPDYERQAMSSCRSAIESVVREISGEGDWSVGLTKIVKHETDRKTVRMAYSYLSGFGTHSVNVPSQDNVQIGITLSMAAINIVLTASGIN